MPHSVIARLLRCRTVKGPPLKARLPMHTPFHAGHRLPLQPVPLGGSVRACCGTASCPILRAHVRAGGHRQQCVRGSLCVAGLQNRADRAAEKGGRVAGRPAPGEPSYGRGGVGPFRMQQAAASGRAPISAHGTRMSHPHSICIRPHRGLSQTAKCHVPLGCLGHGSFCAGTPVACCMLYFGHGSFCAGAPAFNRAVCYQRTQAAPLFRRWGREPRCDGRGRASWGRGPPACLGCDER